MLFVQAHKEAKAGMKAHMANESKQHIAQLRKVAARKQALSARREVAATK